MKNNDMRERERESWGVRVRLVKESSFEGYAVTGNQQRHVIVFLSMQIAIWVMEWGRRERERVECECVTGREKVGAVVFSISRNHSPILRPCFSHSHHAWPCLPKTYMHGFN